MSNTVLKAENISKQYRLGLVSSGTLSHDVTRWWYKVRGKEDPFLKIGETNDRSTKGNSDYVWALQDINFEVKRGEVLGIIGKNGAGKSTLLKILSRVTGPTTGVIKTKGRIASLLEVGTGFHPEMTGRENIYLNGAILGMTKKEIQQKEAEIISFSGCQRYIDTPVKRYSSGMRVRLAFAVAAHLEPDILVIDEVLAVGDAEFQKKAIGKMQDIAKGEGRTVLFVSHNMGSIMALCTRCIILEHGMIIKEGSPNVIIDEYLNRNKSVTNGYLAADKPKDLFFSSVATLDASGKSKSYYKINEKIIIQIKVKAKNWNNRFKIGLGINDKYEKRIMISSLHFDEKTSNKELVFSAIIEGDLLTPGVYSMDVSLMDGGSRVEEIIEKALQFEVDFVNTIYAEVNYDYGFIHEKIVWKIN